ncbi:MAG: hypothetical protein WCJ58_01095 [bacterium]
MTETVSIQEPTIVETSNPVQATEQVNQAPVTEPVKTETPKEPVKSASLLDKAASEVKTEKSYWKDDWRQNIAGEDPKLLKELEKHKTPAELAKAYRELQKQFSSTRPTPELAKDATAEQVAEWREKAGIPESWDKYDTTLDNGVVIGENDKPIVESWLKKAHEMNMKPEDAKKSLQAYFEMNNAAESERIRNAEAQQNAVSEELKKQWGVQFKENLTVVATHLEKALGAETFNKLNQAVLPDGSYAINDPAILNHFLKEARQEQGGHTVVASPTTDLPSLMERKKQIEKIALTDEKLYYNSPELRAELNQIEMELASRKK